MENPINGCDFFFVFKTVKPSTSERNSNAIQFTLSIPLISVFTVE